MKLAEAARTNSLLWCVIAFLALIAVSFTVFRILMLSDPMVYEERARDIFPENWLEGATEYNRGFTNRPVSTVLHIIPGSLFVLFAPFQFSSTIRSRHIRFHRWSGRLLVVTALVAGFFGLYLVVEFWFTGPAASSAVLVFGTLFVAAIIRAWTAIRNHDVARHREWMIRAFAIGLGISVVRLVYAPLFLVTGAKPLDVIGLSFWLGWSLSLGAAELWIRTGISRRFTL